MTSPFDAVRRVVGGQRPRPAFVVSEPAVGVFDAVAGGLVARYPATAYTRILERLATTSNRADGSALSTPVAVYTGAVTPATRLTVHGDGSMADYSPGPSAPMIPGGVPVLVVWTTTDATATASCTAQFRQTG